MTGEGNVRYTQYSFFILALGWKCGNDFACLDTFKTTQHYLRSTTNNDDSHLFSNSPSIISVLGQTG